MNKCNVEELSYLRKVSMDKIIEYGRSGSIIDKEEFNIAEAKYKAVFLNSSEEDLKAHAEIIKQMYVRGEY